MEIKDNFVSNFINNLKIKLFYLFFLLSILLIVLSFYFINYNYFIFFAYIPFFFVLYKFEKENKNIKKLVICFYFFQYLFLAFFVNSITSYVKVMYLAYFGLVLALTLVNFIIFYFISFVFIICKSSGKIKNINYPIIYVISQISFEIFMFSGELSFPWFNVSLPVAVYPRFISIASICGYIFVSLWVLLINYFIYLIILRIYGLIFNLKIVEKELKKDKEEDVYYNINLNISKILKKSGQNILFRELKNIIFILIFLILFPFIWFYVDPFKKIEKTDIKITVAQHNYPLNFKFRYEYFPKMIKKILTINEILRNESDLVIWSESSYPDFFMESKENKEALLESVKKNNMNVIIGFPYYDGSKYYNSSGFINNKGEIYIYKKIHLVPFGEFIPFSNYFKFLEKIAPEVGISQTKGILEEPFFISKIDNNGEIKSYKFYVTICFEGIYSYLFYKMKKKGAQFFINITNDSYYLNTYQPRQHLYLQVFRAVEFNTQLFRSSSTGISAVINNRGEITNVINENIAGFTTSNLYLSKSKTIYEMIGFKFIIFLRYFLFIYFCFIFLIILYFKIMIRKKM